MRSHLDGGPAVTTNEFGMTMHKGGGQREGQEQDEGDGGQPTVIDGLTVAVFGNLLRAMSAGVQKAMLKRPVLGEIAPAVVLQNPTIMAEPAHLGSGKGFGVERGDPEPFVRSLLGLKLAFAVMVFGEGFF